MFHAELPCQKLKTFFSTTKKPKIPEDYVVSTNQCLDDTVLQRVKEKELLWALTRLLITNDIGRLSIKSVSQKVPSWSATNSLWTDEAMPVTRKAFGPVLPHPVTKRDTVNTAMINIQGYLEGLAQTKIPVTVDEEVFFFFFFMNGNTERAQCALSRVCIP